MPDDYNVEGYNFDDDVSLDTDEKNVGGAKTDWLKLTTKGQIIRCAFTYFHTYDQNAVQAAMKAARKTGKKLSKDEVTALVKTVLTKRAEELKKSLDQLTVTDKLDTSVAHFKVTKAHYQDGLGFVLSRLGKDGTDADAIWKRLPDPKTYFSTLLLIYPTLEDGLLNKETLAAQIKGKSLKFLPWRFSNQVYEDIWKLQEGFRENSISLAFQDIKLECKEPQYQKISISSAGPAVWQKNETFKNLVLESAPKLYDKLIPFREMTTDQLKVKLGLGGSAVEDVSSDNFQDMLDQV